MAEKKAPLGLGRTEETEKQRPPPRRPKLANVVGAHLRRIRTQLGMTQEQLAERCRSSGLELSRGTLAKIEAQVRLLKACELFIIARVLEVPMEQFYPEEFRALGSQESVKRSNSRGRGD